MALGRLRLRLRREEDSRIVFPWERTRTRFVRITRGRVRFTVALLVALFVATGLSRVEARRRATFATRAAVTTVQRATEAYRADHEGRCPDSLEALAAPSLDGRDAYLARVPRDGWARPFRYTCPGRKHPESADVRSGGPDGTFDDLTQLDE